MFFFRIDKFYNAIIDLGKEVLKLFLIVNKLQRSLKCKEFSFHHVFLIKTVFYNASQNIHKLQLMQNFSAHILTNTRNYDHITPALRALGRLTIEEQLQLRDAPYKCVNNLAPAYRSCKLGKRSAAHAYNLRNSDDLNIRKFRIVAAQRGLFYRASKAWITLSSETRTAPTLRSFRKRAKADFSI